jgi:hypothetical protein
MKNSKPGSYHVDFLVPYSTDGRVPFHYPTLDQSDKYELKPNEPFKAKLKYCYVCYIEGPRLLFENVDTGAGYSFRLEDLRDLFSKVTLKKGIIAGNFRFWREGNKIYLTLAN